MSRWRRLLIRIDLLVHSIRFRLALWFVLILGLVLLVFSGLVFVARIRELRAETATRLQAKLEEIESTFGLGMPGSLIQIPNTPHSPIGREDVLALYNPNGSLAYFSGPLTEPPILDFSQVEREPSERVVEYRTFVTRHDIGQYAFMVTSLAPLGMQPVGYLVLGTPIDPFGELKRLFLELLALIIGMLLLAFLGGFWLADRAMAPVRTISAKARAIGESDLSQRFNLGRKDEIGLLADTFDSMLARLDAAFARQRQFTADASHELRTPLTIVNLEAARALGAPRRPGEYQRVLEIIRSENDLMTRLVNDLLTLARMDAGREPLQKEALDLSDIALEVVERFESLATRHRVELASGELPDVPISGDRQALVRLLSNLVENAIKYTAQNPEGACRRVRVETGLYPDRKLAWARVTDTGPGIPQEHLVHLFDRFYRVDSSRTRPSDSGAEESFPSSSGLGLAIVEGIARLHGGHVDVQSEPEIGTTFELLLPLRAVSPQDQESSLDN